MDLYRTTFVGLLMLNTFALYQTHHRSQGGYSSSTTLPDKKDEREHPDRDGLRRLKWRFFPIYLLVNAADWLQGPYIYPIYKGTLCNFATYS
jgi:hypothetical protein